MTATAPINAATAARDVTLVAWTPEPAATAAAFSECERIARAHYENFTLGSRLLPRHLRRHIAALYAFARTADDLADEEPEPTRALAGLDAWERELEACYAGTPHHPVFVALADTVRTFAIPIEPFRRLLTAFRMDVRFSGFETFDDLQHYCRHSANPVGQLVLHLFRARRRRAAGPLRRHLYRAPAHQFLAGSRRRPPQRPHLSAA